MRGATMNRNKGYDHVESLEDEHAQSFVSSIDDDAEDNDNPAVIPLSHFEIGDLESSSDSSDQVLEASWPEDHLYSATVELHDVEATIVAPCDLPQDYVLRVDLGDGRTIVAQVVSRVEENASL